MKGYVYMVNYKEKKADYFLDQMECTDKNDLLTQLEYLAENDIFVEELYLVKDNDRYIEKSISPSLYKQCRKLLKGNISKYIYLGGEG